MDAKKQPGYVAATYRIQQEVRARLEEEAKRQDRSINWIVNKTLAEALARAQQKQMAQ